MRGRTGEGNEDSVRELVVLVPEQTSLLSDN